MTTVFFTAIGTLTVAFILGMTTVAYRNPRHYKRLMIVPVLLSGLISVASLGAFWSLMFAFRRVDEAISADAFAAYNAAVQTVLYVPLYVGTGACVFFVYFGGLLYLDKLLDGAEEQAAGKPDGDAGPKPVVLIGKPDKRD